MSIEGFSDVLRAPALEGVSPEPEVKSKRDKESSIYNRIMDGSIGSAAEARPLVVEVLQEEMDEDVLAVDQQFHSTTFEVGGRSLLNLVHTDSPGKLGKIQKLLASHSFNDVTMSTALSAAVRNNFSDRVQVVKALLPRPSIELKHVYFILRQATTLAHPDRLPVVMALLAGINFDNISLVLAMVAATRVDHPDTQIVMQAIANKMHSINLEAVRTLLSIESMSPAERSRFLAYLVRIDHPNTAVMVRALLEEPIAFEELC